MASFSKPASNLIHIGIAVFLGVVIITQFFHKNEKFEEMALGEQTVSCQGKKDSNLIHIIKTNEEEETSFLNGWKKRGKKDVLLMFGNSQSHSINSKKTNEVVFSELVHNNLEKRSAYDVMCASVPNANLQEFLLMFEYWRTKLPIKVLVIPVFMDDLREEGINEALFPNIANCNFLISDSSASICRLINNHLRGWSKTGIAHSNDMAALHETIQERSEKKLNSWLNQNFPAWSYRPNVRGDLLRRMFFLRNKIFGITPNTKRRIIAEPYNHNMAALEDLLGKCEKLNIKVILYIPPIRHDVEIPYVLNEYTAFKDRIAESARAHHCTFYNWEAIVPGELWGMKESTDGSGKPELDYMHFKFKGHLILADSLVKAIETTAL